MLNLVKLCVGISAIEELQAHIDYRVEQKRAKGLSDEQIHTTRMMPKKAKELLDGGSLYWVIKGNIQVRQIICDIRPFQDSEGIRRCDIVMEPRLIATFWQPSRAFQGGPIRILQRTQLQFQYRDQDTFLWIPLRLRLTAVRPGSNHPARDGDGCL